ncbi:hypothetical protein I602_729 [Polaribacter dokdonensis DSW-5]|jgi:hypothetical protein|uniref:Uncharacterized protein n=1 Tax=Polaribacter dokdonensis DSW-5 TaxID=1300348 RepID=A0A0M9CFL5_9FLAO|nr:hypothetical protein I602_729 [Polaribacter dokdonensis DSW-5]
MRTKEYFTSYAKSSKKFNLKEEDTVYDQFVYWFRDFLDSAE